MEGGSKKEKGGQGGIRGINVMEKYTTKIKNEKTTGNLIYVVFSGCIEKYICVLDG